jgi:hypothetical protein
MVNKFNIESKNNLIFAIIIIATISLIFLKTEIFYYTNKLINKFSIKERVILSDAELEDVFINRTNILLKSLKFKNFRVLQNIIHPVFGIKLSPYSYILEQDKIIYADELLKYYNDDTIYNWGYQGDMNLINLTFQDYYNQYIYNQDFANYDQLNFNKLSTPLQTLDNTRKYYNNAIIMEVQINNKINNNYDLLRLIFETYKNKWYLIAIVNLRDIKKISN